MKNTSNLDEIKSVILDSEEIVRDLKGVGMLLQHINISMIQNELIDEIDYLALNVLVNKLLDDIAPRANELINAAYILLNKESIWEI